MNPVSDPPTSDDAIQSQPPGVADAPSAQNNELSVGPRTDLAYIIDMNSDPITGDPERDVLHKSRNQVRPLVNLIAYTEYLEKEVEWLRENQNSGGEVSTAKRVLEDQNSDGKVKIKKSLPVRQPSLLSRRYRKPRRSRPSSSTESLEPQSESEKDTLSLDGQEDPNATQHKKTVKNKRKMIGGIKRLKAIKDPHASDLEIFDDDREFKAAYGIRGTGKVHAIEYISIYSRARDVKSSRIVINSELLVETLGRIVPQHTGHALLPRKDGTMVLDEPFPQLFYRRKLIEDALEDGNDDNQNHIKLLLRLLREQCPEISKVVDEIEANRCQTIEFNQLWLLYEPGTLIYTLNDGEWQVAKVERIYGLSMTGTGSRGVLTLDVSFAGFDRNGTRLRIIYRRLNIQSYAGERRIEDLQHIPAHHLPNETEIRKEVSQRGVSFWNLRDTSHFLDYHGQAWPTQEKNEPVRVIVDYATSSKRPQRRRRRAEDSYSSEGTNDEYERPPLPPSRPRSRDGEEDVTETLNPYQKPEDLFLFCPSHVDAFSLRNKDWRKVKIKDLKEVSFVKDAFKKLVIENRYKAVVTAMVRSYLEEIGRFRDLVKGKGKGLVLLLHGAPGTGKTLTAECVAENEKRPLYMITSGDLGTFGDDLQRNLRTSFENAVNWNAVLLLDEADVFLQERDVQALDRNALVSVFLRELEYFNGVLFLTTNRPGLLDEAFHSRIHITLHLPDLSADSRMRIWAIFVKELEIDMEAKRELIRDIERDLRDSPLNGRQIRNCMRAALALAGQEKVPVSIKHIKDVVQIGRRFTDYMTDVNRMNQSQRAAALGMRLMRTGSDLAS